MKGKKKLSKLLYAALLIALALLSFSLQRNGDNAVSVGIIGGADGPTGIILSERTPAAAPETSEAPDKDGSYDSKEEVALYIHVYGCLPQNYVTKAEAQKAGWSSGSLEKYLPGKCIGGSFYGNYEGLLPDAPGRRWTECDIDTLGASSRGAKRIVFSNDGLIYYTGDHYESFELLYD